MRSKSTWIGIFFIAAALVAAFVLGQLFTSIFAVAGWTNRPVPTDSSRFLLSDLLSVVVAGALAAGLYAQKRMRALVGECIDELYKIHWPTLTETRVNTLVVIVTSLIAAAILGVFDITFGWLSSHNLFLY